MVQIIASDMDGTLLNDEMVISPGNAAAIKHAQSLGVHFVVSSGRSLEEIKPLIPGCRHYLSYDHAKRCNRLG